MLNEVDLTRPCDGCGRPIGGAFHYCPKCTIYFCFYCGVCLINAGTKFPLRCPSVERNSNNNLTILSTEKKKWSVYYYWSLRLKDLSNKIIGLTDNLGQSLLS